MGELLCGDFCVIKENPHCGILSYHIAEAAPQRCDLFDHITQLPARSL